MLSKRVIFAFVFALSALFAVGWLTRLEINRITSASVTAIDANKLLMSARRLRELPSDTQSFGWSSELPGVLDELGKLTATNANQTRRLERILFLTKQSADKGSEEVLEIRLLLDEMEIEQRDDIERQREAAARGAERAFVLLMVGISVVLVPVMWLALVTHRHVRASSDAELSLTELQRNTESILSAAGQGVCHFDSTGTITYANAAATHLLGWEYSELIGANGHQLLHHSHADGSPYPAEECRIAGVIASGKAQRIRGEVCWRKDGTSFPAEYVCTPIRQSNKVTGGLVTFADVGDRDRTLNELQTANARLRSSMDELRRRSLEITSLSKLAELLQISGSIEEACRVATSALADLFPQGSGAISLISSSRNLVEVKGHWGSAYSGAEVFSPDECWALRRGKAHLTSDSRAADHCPHAQGLQIASHHLCIPMIAQGDAIGVFSLSDGNSALSESQQRLSVAISEQVTLALANLRLRETLRQQSIRDPLTGLYNRRYLDESAERELRRSERHQKPVSVLMLDVDHFKRFNDTFGHEAGDAMLREIGQLLRASVRREDIACRYGGEELAVIMPDVPLDKAMERAASLADLVRHLDLVVHGQAVGRVTLSIGIAAFPAHGTEWRSVLHAADLALYRAKKEGRDRIVLAVAEFVDQSSELANVQKSG